MKKVMMLTIASVVIGGSAVGVKKDPMGLKKIKNWVGEVKQKIVNKKILKKQARTEKPITKEATAVMGITYKYQDTIKIVDTKKEKYVKIIIDIIKKIRARLTENNREEAEKHLKEVENDMIKKTITNYDEICQKLAKAIKLVPKKSKS